MIDGLLWLIPAKHYYGAIRPEHVRAFASLCTTRGVGELFIHTGLTDGTSRDVIDRHAAIEIASGQRLLALITCGLLSIGGRAL